MAQEENIFSKAGIKTRSDFPDVAETLVLVRVQWPEEEEG